MRYLWGLVLASGMVIGQPGSAKAQFSLSIGNPYYGTGLTIGSPLGYGYGYNSYSSYNYGPGYGSYGYNSGYLGTPAVVGVPVAPGYGYPYAYGGRSFGYSSGYQGVNRGFYGPRYGPTPGFRQNWLYRGFRP